MIIYVVFQEGVNRHTCGGIFTDKQVAINVADDAARNDKDSYHSYNVVPFELGIKSEFESNIKWFPGFKEQESIYSIKKEDLKS